ncbi:uncharacterized protein LOC130791586 isoform X2 [Actinidia eriantha]|uniref:uncharacterized protein LOC130791586 isoform X2 n=1 Tax=Actinidia eriantha TaxID=165200 RepID=UPI002584C72E|nr:uncharacterized protein LOC130791586 isoform X2 [Actinidia eriantha]
MDMEIDPPKPEVGDEQGIKVEDLFNATEKGESSIFRALSQAQLLKALSLRNEDCRSLVHVAASSGHAERSDLVIIGFCCLFQVESLEERFVGLASSMIGKQRVFCLP